jgi:hypothetical protein
MLLWTHFFNLLSKLLACAIAAYTLYVLGLYESMRNSEFVLILATGVIGGIIYIFFLRHVANWLYARITLRTPVEWQDVYVLEYLFSLDSQNEWLPMKTVRNLSVIERRQALLSAGEEAMKSREFNILRYL